MTSRVDTKTAIAFLFAFQRHTKAEGWDLYHAILTIKQYQLKAVCDANGLDKLTERELLAILRALRLELEKQ